MESPLVVPATQPLLGGQGLREAEAVRLSSPESVSAREASQTKYEALGGSEAASLLGEAFPGFVSTPGGGPPGLPEGQKSVGFLANNAERVELPGGRSGVVESTAPMAMQSGNQWRPVDLGLSESPTGFSLANPVVELGIPKRLQSGVSLGGLGVSVSMVDSTGSAAGSDEGRIAGSTVFYGGVGVGADVDAVVKPDTYGFSEDAILRSKASPSELFYKVGLPEGATLAQADDGSGSVNVVAAGTVIASIAAPRAADAAGRIVPVSTRVQGNILALKIEKTANEYQYPILVDPEVSDWRLGKGEGHTTNWHLARSEGAEHFSGGEKAGYQNIYVAGNHTEHEWGALEYTTQGESRIGYMNVEKAYIKDAGARVDNLMEIVSSKGALEGKSELPEQNERGEIWNFVCTPEPSCREGKGNLGTANNSAEYLETSTHAGEGTSGEFTVEKSSVSIFQEKGPEVSADTTHETVDGRKNVLYGSGSWLSPSNGAFEIHATDPGVGISYFWMRAGRSLSGYSETKNFIENYECTGGVQCFPEVNKAYTYSIGSLPEGEDEIEALVKDAVGLEAHHYPLAKFKVDGAPPHEITLKELPGSHEITDGQHVLLKASAKDGEGETPSSGVASIAMFMDGREVGTSTKGCSPGPCTANAEFTLSGENYAAGQYTLAIVATDKAGNVAESTNQVTIRHAESVPVGPGSVNPVTGELSLSATDVAMSVPDGSLSVARSYRSRHVAQGAEGPLGPQWNLSLGTQQSLTRVQNGMVLTGSTGGEVVFASSGKGEFTSPAGDAGMVLLEKTGEKGTYFTLSDNGSITTFEIPSGGSSVWMPSSVEGPNGTNASFYKFKISSGVIEPTEELAPVPAGVSCGKEISELTEGCRALKFEYGTKKEAKGEKASEWGEYTGRLSKIKYIAWNASKTKTETPVAEYAYDAKGRLRAEWNPEVKPALKMTYGYDLEGHVTAASSPGHEPTLFEQGTIVGESNPGRLLAVAVPSAAKALGNGEAPASKEIPTLSSTKPAVGTKISVNLVGEEKTPGQWGASPLAFIYQWKDCNAAGEECTPIAGAVNQAYYPVASDEGHRLVAEAIALNATGATSATSLATSAVATGTPNSPLPEPPYVGSDAVTTLEYQVPVSGSGAPYQMSSAETAKWGQSDDPSETTGAMATFPPTKVMGWPAKEYTGETVYYVDGKDRAVNVAAPTGGITTTEYNPYNDITRTLTADNRKKALEETGKTAEASKLLDTENTYEESGSEPGTELLSTVGPQHMVKIVAGINNKPEERLARLYKRYSYEEAGYHLVTREEDSAETAPVEVEPEVFVSHWDYRTTKTSYNGQENLGLKLHKPTSVEAGSLLHTTLYDALTGNVIETKKPGTPIMQHQFSSEGSRTTQLRQPVGAAGSSKSYYIWIADYNNHRIAEYETSGVARYTMGSEEGVGDYEFRNPWGIAIAKSGNIFVTDYTNDRVVEYSSSRKFVRMFGYGVSDGLEKFEVCTATECHAGLSGSGAGQFNGPTGIAIDSSENVWVVDSKNSRIEEFTSTGEYVKQIAGKKGSGNGELDEPGGLAVAAGNLYVADAFNNRVEEFSPEGKYEGQFGTKGKGHGQFETPEGITTLSSENLAVLDTKNSRVEEFTPKGVFQTEFTGGVGSGTGQAKEPEGITTDKTGNIYIIDTGNSRVEKWTPPTGVGNQEAGDAKTIYYTKAANPEYSECGEHPAWANLPCETRPAGQPEISGLPELPITKYTYNLYNEPETTTETVGATTRTKTNTYDSGGRLKTAAITSTVGNPLTTITYEYNSETGALEKQCANSGKPCTEGSPKTITTIQNRLGQLASYTDASENTTTYEYEKEKAARLTKIEDKQGTETYKYNETTGRLEELLYANGTTSVPFTATYDVEGNLSTENYPNGMTATYNYNAVATPTVLEYKKTTHCTEKCVWFSDSVIPSIHGQWIEQTSTLSHQTYSYDSVGRLTEVQNTPAGKGCTTRIYTYDRDTNRTSLTTREPGTEGKCATTGGKTETHTYDTADRLTDTGTSYNTFGDITTLPAQNTEDPELTSTYYVDNQAASQKQNKQTISYTLDPADRTLETASTGEPNNATITSHYAEPGNDAAWTANALTKEWSRNIPGIDGKLAAIQSNGETPELQLTNLHGDIIAKAYMSETATELAAKADTSEYGVPTVNLPAKYSWLGAIQLPTELPSGVVSMGVRSYVPQIGRYLQPDPITGGSANAYSYTFGDPINTSDPTGSYVEGAYLQTFNNQENQHAVEREAEREAAARAAAEQAAREAAEAAAQAGPQYEGEEGEWEEWSEEEGGYEDAAYHRGTEGQEEAYLEEGLFYQPLGEGAVGRGRVKASGAVSMCGGEQLGKEPCGRDVGWSIVEEAVGSVGRTFLRAGEAITHVWHGVKRTVMHFLYGHHPSKKDYVCTGAATSAGALSLRAGAWTSLGVGAAAGLVCAALY